MKKNKKDLKIEFKSKRLSTGCYEFRRCFWRIVPSELSWWKRPFNRWKIIQVFNSTFSTLNDICGPWEFSQIKETCKNVGDIEERNQTVQNQLLEAISRKEAAWEDED